MRAEFTERFVKAGVLYALHLTATTSLTKHASFALRASGKQAVQLSMSGQINIDEKGNSMKNLSEAGKELAGESGETLRAAQGDGGDGVLPCPFCGLFPATAYKDTRIIIYCGNKACKVSVDTSWLPMAEAVTLWNTRDALGNLIKLEG